MISYPLYKLIIEKKAQKFLENLGEPEYSKLVLKIRDLVSVNPKPLDIKKLQGYKNLYRMKVDDYRVIFVTIPDKKLIIVAMIGHRKEVYDILKHMHL